MLLDENTIKSLNDNLPPQIRAFGYRKVTQSFDAKTNCDARTYMYLLPTMAFCPIDEITNEKYRASEDVIKLVNDTLKVYVGTHNFHNFTSGKKYIDPSAKRFIMSFECEKPFVKDDVEFAVIKVKGQSFMLHQIRYKTKWILIRINVFYLEK
jgi:tRNA pseudouridine38-40 synthase